MSIENSNLPSTKGRGSAVGDLLLVALCSAAVFAFAHFQGLTSRYVVNDDVRQQLFWMQKWRDPGLFPSDWLSDYAQHYVPWGVQTIYRVAACCTDPLWFSKVLTGVLFVGLALCVHVMARIMHGRALAWTTVAVLWLLPGFLADTSGGLARAFAAPLLASFWLGWLCQSPAAMAAALVLQALCIPYVFPICAVACLLAWAGGRLGWCSRPAFPERAWHFAVIVGAGCLAGLWHAALGGAGYGPLVTAAEMADRPEFGPQGRYPMLPVPSVVHELVMRPWRMIVPGEVIGRGPRAAIVMLLAILLLQGAVRADWKILRRWIQPALCLGLASVLMYSLARACLLRLFVPARYLHSTVNLLYCLGGAWCLSGILRRWSWMRRAAVVLVLAAAILGGLRSRNAGLYDYTEYAPLCAAIEETPKEAVFAGHPEVLDTVATFGRRRAVASFELSHPWCKGMWKRMKPMLDDLFDAYYADDPAVVYEFCRMYRVDYLVVDERHFTREFIQGRPFFAPFDAQIRALAGGKQEFALLSQEFQGVRVSDHVRLVDCRSLRLD